MSNILVYFIGFGDAVGGSEPLPLLLAKSLQENYGVTVTLALSFGSDIEAACKQYGIALDLSKLKVVVLAGKSPIRRLLGKILGCPAELELKRLGPQFDVCISCHGPKDFGRPAYHFIHMLWSFDRSYAVKLGYARKEKLFTVSWAKGIIRGSLKRLIPGAPRSGVTVLKDPRETCYPNSQYVKDTLEKRYGCRIGKVFYPPTLFEGLSGDAECRDLNVAYVGRIQKEKHIEDIVDIVSRCRERTGLDVQLFLAGFVSGDAYTTDLLMKCHDRPWVHFVGQVLGEQKQRFLSAHSFAIHALKEEAFGISITEYLKAGIIPIVPAEGGCAEIVEDSELTYASNDDAAEILGRLLADRDFTARKRVRCNERAQWYSSQMYRQRQSAVMDEIMGRQK